MHRKLFTGLMTAVIFLAGISVSAAAQAESSLPQTLEEIEDTVRMDGEDLLESFDAIGVNAIEYHADGTVFSWYSYVSKDACAYETSDGYIEAINDEENYVYDPSTDTPARLLFLSEENREQYIEALYDTASYHFQGETMISLTEEEGDLILKTSLDEETAPAYLEQLGYEYQKGDTVEWTYQIDQDIDAFASSSAVLIQEDGTETDIFESHLNTGPEEYVFSPEILERLDNEDSRTVTVISDPGTENEKTVSETVGKGCAVSFYVEGITLYKDEDCTEVSEDVADLESDLTLYVRTEE